MDLEKGLNPRLDLIDSNCFMFDGSAATRLKTMLILDAGRGRGRAEDGCGGQTRPDGGQRSGHGGY